MSTIIDKSLRDELKARGVWGDFVRRCGEVKASDGVGEKLANRKVLDEMAADGRIPKEIVPVRKRPGHQPRTTSCSGESFVDVPSVTSSMFDGKTCSYSDAIVWAYGNHRFVDVKPEDAPSAMAWNMLLDMRQSPSVKADWMGKCIAKWMARADDESFERGLFDGEREYDLLGAIESSGGGV